MTFDEVLPTLLRAGEEWPHAANLKRVAVVRDLRGRVRVVVEQFKRDNAQIKDLTAHLRQELGDWFADDVLSTSGGTPAENSVASKVLDNAREPVTVGYPDGAGGISPLTANRWWLLERRVGKQPWLEGSTTPPWRLTAAGPSTVTFYSFKGGVGRTTTLAACTLLAAEASEDVVVIDLDLEAPGLASLFGITSSRGVLDFLVDHVATRSTDIGQIVFAPTNLPSRLSDRIKVIPAGALGHGYLEKLARLDFASSTIDQKAQSPMRAALHALLHQVRTQLNPRWIFVDARAGLHDLAGLSLHGLAHLDVLFSRANRQGYDGLGIVLRALSRQTHSSAARVVLVHAMAAVSDEVAETQNSRLRHVAYELFKDLVYSARGVTFQEMALDGDHFPWMIRRNERIELNDNLNDVTEALGSLDYREVWKRIRLLTTPVGTGAP